MILKWARIKKKFLMIFEISNLRTIFAELLKQFTEYLSRSDAITKKGFQGGWREVLEFSYPKTKIFQNIISVQYLLLLFRIRKARETFRKNAHGKVRKKFF